MIFVKKINKIRNFRKRHFRESEVELSEPLYELLDQESFVIQYFVYIVIKLPVHLERRFEQCKQYEDIFGFLFTIEKVEVTKYQWTIGKLQKFWKHVTKWPYLRYRWWSFVQYTWIERKRKLSIEHNISNAILNFLKIIKLIQFIV